ncbi:MAG TPA: methyltransferase type 11 [Elusimicrobia bacterium]|nr:methyltransferase type 11 [Elusimicrobiota bacterium]
MCDPACILFGAMNLRKEEAEGKKVLEVGSRNVNGGLRPLIESWRPAEYVGVDFIAGPGVDVVLGADALVDKFGKESFDLVLSTEMLEHVRDWRKVISNLKNVCRENGVVLITTRRQGSEYHAYPYDFWRYEVEDLKNIFSDFVIEKVENDALSPGVFVKARKPAGFTEKDLSGCELYSIITNSRVKEIGEKTLASFHKRYARALFLKEMAYKIAAPVYRLIKFGSLK